MRSEILLLILGMAIVTYLTRFTCLYLFRHVTLPASLSRGFRYVPVGILTAMVVPGIVLSEGRVFIHWQNFYLVAGFASFLAALRWKNMFASLGAGLLVILLLRRFL
jgi:branched-subunit amino acid transport protein